MCRGVKRVQKLSSDEREQLLKRLMSSYGDQVIKTCFLFLRSRQQAEDASQETFIRAWKALDRLKEGPTEKAWLMKIAVNVCKSFLGNRSAAILDRGVPLDRLSETGKRDQYPDQTVYLAVASLPDKYRAAVILYYYQGLSVRETADALRLPGATVRTRLARARALLKEDLKGWYFDDE